MLGSIYEVASAGYELSTVVTDVILNYEYINRNWLEEYILSLVFLVGSGVVMGFVGVGIDALYPDRYSSNKPLNKVIGFSIGLLQMRVFIETLCSVAATIKGEDKNAAHDRTYMVGGQTAAEETRNGVRRQAKELQHGLLYANFIQAIVRDVPLFILQANATIHYRKWQFIDLFTVISTFTMLTRGTATYVAKEDGGGIRFLAFIFLAGQFVFRLGAILLLAMTKGMGIVVYGAVVTLIAIFVTAKLRLAHPSRRFFDQLPRAFIFFPFFTVFVVDGSMLTARFGSAVAALSSNKLLKLHLWRCLENAVAIILAIFLPRYTDFGVSSDTTVLIIGGICAGIYVVTAVVYYGATKCCSKRAHSAACEQVETPYNCSS